MRRHATQSRIDLPRGWPRRIKLAMLNVIALSQYAVAYTRSWAVIDGRIARVRPKAKNGQLRQQGSAPIEQARSGKLGR